MRPFLLFMIVSVLGHAVSAPAEVPLRSFLPVSSALSRELSRHFQISIPEGLYFTDQRATLLEPALLFSNPQTRFTYDGSYLANDQYNDYLYGEKGWKWRGLRQLARGPKGELGIRPVAEFQLFADWVQSRDAQGRRVDALWIARTNGEKWLLYTRIQGEAGSANRLLAIPSFLLPLEDGLIAVAQDFVLNRRFLKGEFQTEFQITEGDKKTRTQKIVIASHGTHARRRPLLAYNRERGTLLFAGLEQKDGTKATKLSENAISAGEAVKLFSLNLKTGTVSVLVYDLRYPFTLTPNGPIRRQSGKSQILAVDWERQTVGSWLPHEQAAALAEGVPPSPLGSLTAEDLTRIQQLGYPEDLLTALRSGESVPFAYQPEVSERLVRVLSRPSDTLALLLYEDGQEPLEYLKSTFKAVDVQAIASGAALHDLDHVFRIPQAVLLGPRRTIAFSELLKMLRELCSQKRVVLYFEDFPYSGDRPSSETVGSKLVQALKEFEAEMSPAFAEGKCRAVWSIRQKLYESLREHAPTAFGLGTSVQITEPGKDIRFEMAQMTARRLGQRFKLYLSPEAFALSLEQAEREREKTGALKTPGIYRAFYMDLYDFAALTLDPQGQGVLDTHFVEDYRQRRANRWTLEYADWEPSPGDKRGKIPVWAKWNGARPEKVDVLTEAQYSVWKANPASLISNLRFQHALFVTDTESEKANVGVDILVANSRSIRALEFAPLFPELHPRGFYFLRADRVGEADKKEATLCFFDLVKAVELDGKLDGSPDGVIRILKAGINMNDLAERVISISYEDDLAVIQRNGAVLGNAEQSRTPKTFYGPDGLILEGVEK